MGRRKMAAEGHLYVSCIAAGILNQCSCKNIQLSPPPAPTTHVSRARKRAYSVSIAKYANNIIQEPTHFTE